MMTAVKTVSEYARIFETERNEQYPAIDAFEQAQGYALERIKLEAAARILACPLKTNPPNWQHGRVLYAVARRYFESLPPETWINTLDIGTAKGFSALCVQWALMDAKRHGQVVSVDVLNPYGVEPRNTVVELTGPKTLMQILEPWPEADAIEFHKCTGIDYLRQHVRRQHFAFVDGKHSGEVVAQEAALLARRQETGDVVIFDDAQIPDVAAAIQSAKGYALTTLTAKPGREYVIAVRFG